jgi:hypothetical protein
MQHSKVTSALISTAVKFQSYSDEKKQAMEVEACERKGVRDVHLEIVANFRLREAGEVVYSETADWCGLEWYIEVQNEEAFHGKPGVEMYLCCDEASGNLKSCADQAYIIGYRFYLRTWPNGLWKLLLKGSEPLSSFVDDGWGSADGLGMSWKDARQYVGSTGTIAIKVVARRLKHGS